MKKAVIIPDSFKGTLSSKEVCELIEKSLKKKYEDIICVGIPIADGGEGTLDSFCYALGGATIVLRAHDPVGKIINSEYLVLDDTAIIEMANVNGITLLDALSPMSASTFGTGEIIKDVLDRGIRKIIIGIGGSASTDGGMGCLCALGARFLDENGNDVPLGGKGLSQIKSISLEKFDSRIKECAFTVLSDVENALYGKSGAAYIFAKQKGADENQIEELDRGLRNFADKVKTCFGEDYANVKGAGAAGGLGFALLTFFSAKIESGIDAMLDICGFSEKIKDADVIITGEGKMDKQSLSGKVPFGVAKRAEGVPVIAVVGTSEISEAEAKEFGIDKIIETNAEKLPFDEVKKKCREQLLKAASKINL